MNRLVLFSFYDPEGIADEYVFYLLKELRCVASELVVIVNGNINDSDKGRMYQISDEVIQRKNEGYDAGAYKDAIFNYIGVERLKNYDELVLCNDTFFGPLLPFEIIWNKFENKDVDFWGLHFWQAGYFECVSSFFIVYRKCILSDERFYKYWIENIDEKCANIREVYGAFELGLFFKLCELGYRYDVYADKDACHIMKSPDWAVIKYKVPFIKKKVFAPEYYSWENVYKVLSYISTTRIFDISLISKNVYRKYGWKLEWNTLEQAGNMYSKEYMTYPSNRSVKDIIALRQMCDAWGEKKVYIYGAGDVAAKIYFLLRKNIGNFGGFVVSKQDNQRFLFEYPVVEYKKGDLNGDCVIVGLNPQNSDEVRGILPETENIVYIWGCTEAE